MCVCMCDRTSECASVCVKKVNYIGHDVKGKFLVGEMVPAPLSSYHGDGTTNSCLYLNTSVTLIKAIYIVKSILQFKTQTQT